MENSCGFIFQKSVGNLIQGIRMYSKESYSHRPLLQGYSILKKIEHTPGTCLRNYKAHVSNKSEGGKKKINYSESANK